MTRKQQKVFAGLGRDVNRMLWYGRIILAALVLLVSIIGAACGHLVNLFYSL